jgi:hypothetical protein
LEDEKDKSPKKLKPDPEQAKPMMIYMLGYTREDGARPDLSEMVQSFHSTKRGALLAALNSMVENHLSNADTDDEAKQTWSDIRKKFGEYNMIIDETGPIQSSKATDKDLEDCLDELQAYPLFYEILEKPLDVVN